MRKITLFNSDLKCLVDDADFPLVSRFSWAILSGSAGKKYAICNENKTLMHRMILNVYQRDKYVDHINGNPLDNRRSNMRICSHADNQANKKLQKNSKTGFKGVGYYSGKFRARIYKNKKWYYLGSFKSKEDAARAYDLKARELFGEFAKLNF